MFLRRLPDETEQRWCKYGLCDGNILHILGWGVLPDLSITLIHYWVGLMFPFVLRCIVVLSWFAPLSRAVYYLLAPSVRRCRRIFLGRCRCPTAGRRCRCHSISWGRYRCPMVGRRCRHRISRRRCRCVTVSHRYTACTRCRWYVVLYLLIMFLTCIVRMCNGCRMCIVLRGAPGFRCRVGCAQIVFLENPTIHVCMLDHLRRHEGECCHPSWYRSPFFVVDLLRTQRKRKRK